MKTSINEALLCDLKTILGCLDGESILADSQRAAIAIFEQLQNQTYTIYSESFSNTTWKDECESLGVPHESERVEVRFIVESLEIDTRSVAKHFSITPESVWERQGRIYCVTKGESHDLLVAHIEGDKIVYDVNPIFAIGETFTLPYEEYEEDGVTQKTITETYTITEYDLSGCHSNGIVYLGDGGSAWIMEDALVEQKAIAKIGDKFEIHFDYYETGELTEHTITRIDFSKTESDEVLYCDDNTQVYITEREMLKYKASTHFTIVDENQYCVVSGRYFAADDDVERMLNETDASYTGSGRFYIQNDDIGTFYKDRGFNVEFLARSAFCVQAIPIGEASTTFLVHTDVLDSILKNEITTTEQLEMLVSLVNDSPTLEQGMNVGQLIAELQKLDPDKLVTIVVGNEDQNIVDTKQFQLHATDDSVDYVEFFVHG